MCDCVCECKEMEGERERLCGRMCESSAWVCVVVALSVGNWRERMGVYECNSIQVLVSNRQ